MLGSRIPDVGPAFGLADLFFNFATGLTTDPKKNQTGPMIGSIYECYCYVARL
jgi:hypothetical protein